MTSATDIFPDRIVLTTKQGHYTARPDPNGNAVKDDAGEIIIMAYTGPTSDGQASHMFWVVAHDQPSRVHPALKYAYQRYRVIA